MAEGNEQIDPQRHRLFLLFGSVAYATWVVAESEEAARKEAATHVREDTDGVEPTLSVMRPERRPGDDVIAWGPSMHGDRELNVQEVYDLLAALNPEYDRQTLLMPFVSTPPPLRSAGAAGGQR